MFNPKKRKMSWHTEGDTSSNDCSSFLHTMKRDDTINEWKPNELDCDSPYVAKPFVSIGLLGYSVYEALNDRPAAYFDNNIYDWYQKLGTIWHNRLIHWSESHGKTNPYKGCTCEASECDIMVIPSIRLYKGRTNGCFIPEKHIFCHKKGTVCMVMIAFGEDEEGEEYMQVLHRSRVDVTLLEKFSEMRKVNELEYDIIRSAWTIDNDPQLEKLFDSTNVSEWRYIFSKEERLAKQKDIQEQMYDKHGRYRVRPRLPLIQNLYTCRVPYLYYENGIVPMFTPHKDDAVKMARSMGLGMFAYDFYTGFAKKFVVCTAQAAYNMIYKRQTYCIPVADKDLHAVGYKSMYEGLIHSYPHKLILDLEYERCHNPHWEEDDKKIVTKKAPPHANMLTLKMIKYVGQLLNFINDDDWTPSIEDWIILQADSEKKISRHAILNAPGKFFRSMDDACRFRDVVKAVVEAGLMEEDPVVLDLMVNTCVKADEKTLKLLSKGSSPAQQCFINGHWKTCFNDWCVINNTFRLMRTCGSTKFGQDRYLRHADEISHFDTIDHPGNTMVQLYKEAYGMRPDAPVTKEWIAFMASLVQNPVPKDAPGWIVPDSKVNEIVSALHRMVKEAVYDFQDKWNQLITGDTSKEEYGVIYCENKAQLARDRGVKRKRTMREVNVTKQMSSTMGRIEKYEISPDDPCYTNVMRILQSVKDIDPVVRSTESWRIQSCYTSKDKENGKKGPAWYSAMPNSPYCPIGGMHSKSGKTLINISKAGKITATCLGARCVGTKWTATQKLSSTALHLLWEK